MEWESQWKRGGKRWRMERKREIVRTICKASGCPEFDGGKCPNLQNDEYVEALFPLAMTVVLSVIRGKAKAGTYGVMKDVVLN